MKGGPGRIFVFDDDGDDYEDKKTKKDEDLPDGFGKGGTRSYYFHSLQ